MDEIIRQLQRHVAQDPTNVSLLFELFILLMRVGRDAEAAEIAVQLARLGAQYLVLRYLQDLPAAAREQIIDAIAAADVNVAAILLAGLYAGGQALWLFGAGLALPASKMGELSIELPGDEQALAAFEALSSAYRNHKRRRDNYTHAPSWTKLRELMNDADALRYDIRHFLQEYPNDSRKSVVEAMLRQVEEWRKQYYNTDVPAAPVQPPQRPHPPKPPAPQPAPSAPTPVPPTIAKPPTLEWLEGNDIRKKIQEYKDWIRKAKKKLQEAKPWEDGYKKDLNEQINEIMKLIEKLSQRAREIGQDTGEEWDEPLEDPPPPPWEMMEVFHIKPWHQYVNTKTGELRDFTDDAPPASEDWVRVEFDPQTGKFNIHWGWVQQHDPEADKMTWKPGWLLTD